MKAECGIRSSGGQEKPALFEVSSSERGEFVRGQAVKKAAKTFYWRGRFSVSKSGDRKKKGKGGGQLRD